jgi:hypothetical protein
MLSFYDVVVFFLGQEMVERRIMDKKTRDQNGRTNDEEENALQFEGIIYGLPGASPGSQFVIRVHVYSEIRLHSPTDENPVIQISEDEKTVAGRIVKRRPGLNSTRNPSQHKDTTGMNDDHVDGRIYIMPQGEDVDLSKIGHRPVSPSWLRKSITGSTGSRSDSSNHGFLKRSIKKYRFKRSIIFPSATNSYFAKRRSGSSWGGGSSLLKHTRQSAISDNHFHRKMNSQPLANEDFDATKQSYSSKSHITASSKHNESPQKPKLYPS